MSLTREDLENGLMRRLFSESSQKVHCLTDEELDASIRCILSAHRPGEDLWVFGYGSLVWNPLFHYVERRTATLRGFHRRFCLWSEMGRGTPENPGLVLGLDHGGVCRGVAYRIGGKQAAAELRLLWRREMVVASYCPRWVRVDTIPHAAPKGHSAEVRALAFVVNREHPNYAGRLPTAAVVASLASAQGHIGPCADYFAKTVEALAEHGIDDPHLRELSEGLARKRRTASGNLP